MFSKVLHMIKGSSADTKSTMYVLISRIIKIKE